MRTAAVVLTGLALLAIPVAAASPPSTGPSIVAVYPNPVADGDAGEYVVVDVPTGNTGALRLSDGEQTVPVPNGSGEGRIVLTAAGDALPENVEGEVVELPTWPALANGGERVTLARGNRTLDAVTYEDAPEGELAIRGEGGVTWQPRGATDFEPVAGGPTTVRAFALPDAPGVPVETLRSADNRILLAGYTLTSERVADALVTAADRGVTVEVLVDGAPVGGLTERSATVLDRLVAANVSVRVASGPTAPYRFHHAKYAVVDDRAVVLTENWKPAGTGGRSSRGWGAVVDGGQTVAGLAETFRADTREWVTVGWRAFRDGEDFELIGPSSSHYPTRFEAKRVRARRAELLVAPDNAARGVGRLIDNASESVRIVQVSVDGLDNRLLSASIDAARRGVDVKLLLSQAWYTAEDNRALARNLSALADREDLDVSVRLADPNGRFEKIHAKGVLVDGKHVVLGSLNWNDNAFDNNREVALVLSGERVAGYYGRVFAADWRGGIWRLTVGFALALLIAVLLAVAAGGRIEFRPE